MCAKDREDVIKWKEGRMRDGVCLKQHARETGCSSPGSRLKPSSILPRLLVNLPRLDIWKPPPLQLSSSSPLISPHPFTPSALMCVNLALLQKKLQFSPVQNPLWSLVGQWNLTCEFHLEQLSLILSFYCYQSNISTVRWRKFWTWVYCFPVLCPWELQLCCRLGRSVPFM